MLDCCHCSDADFTQSSAQYRIDIQGSTYKEVKVVSGNEYEFEVEQGTQFRLQLSGNTTGRNPKVLLNGQVIPTGPNPNIFYGPNSIDIPSAQQFHTGQYKAIAPNGAEITFRLKVIGTS